MVQLPRLGRNLKATLVKLHKHFENTLCLLKTWLSITGFPSYNCPEKPFKFQENQLSHLWKRSWTRLSLNLCCFNILLGWGCGPVGERLLAYANSGFNPQYTKRNRILIASYSARHFQYFRNLLLDENTLGEWNQSKKVGDNEIFNTVVKSNDLRFTITIQ